MKTPSQKSDELQEKLGYEKPIIKAIFFKVSFDAIKNIFKKGVRDAKKVFNRITGYLS